MRTLRWRILRWWGDWTQTASQNNKNGAICTINLIKGGGGKLKGRTWSYGRKERLYILKEDVSSPAISLEYLLTSIITD